ncbi:MAG: GtrA family protein [Kiritimatiellia bacterium]|jgi:putative flippase GtrA
MPAPNPPSTRPPDSVPFPRTPAEAWRQFIGDGASAHPIVQFAKYAVAGGIATAVNILAFFLAGWFLFPCLTETDPLVRLLSRFAEVVLPAVGDGVRATHTVYCNIVAYFVSNTVCYLLNRFFVFKAGRHNVVLECLMFFGVSAISTGAGTGLQALLIARLGMETTPAFAANLVTALAINYALRKFVIFKG